MPDQHDPSQVRDRLRRKPDFMRSRSLKVMSLIMLVGVGLWIYAAATSPPTPPSGAGATALTTGAVPAGRAGSRLIDESAPATFRLGFSFVVGFFIAYVFRRFIRMLLLAAGGIGALLIILKATGLLNLDFSQVQEEVDRGIEAAQQHAGRAKDFLLGYVPSGLSAGAGMLAGSRRRG